VRTVAKCSLALSLVAVVSWAFANVAVGQDAKDAAKADSTAAATKPADAPSDRQQRRAARRQAEAAATANADAQSSAAAKTPAHKAAEAAAPAAPKMECRTQPVTGTRLNKNVCATSEQWKEAEEKAAETLRQYRTAPTQQGQTGGASGP